VSLLQLCRVKMEVAKIVSMDVVNFMGTNLTRRAYRPAEWRAYTNGGAADIAVDRGPGQARRL